ncbi:MAG: biopolymer transporter ExbD [Candidatus Scalindua sp.]|jgi:biopolymer transport protein ExbD|nr:biopolymer transporter ExbD [Candidatus Scalindua sp.]MBT5304763.1 biopolymer transporter ExbD [Candidatus Scalindua sp.]MBT6050648.1 biopolymer transporter ExbD [Candidatus Scalindua sp.]MBT6228366.1 biopolymer transporter ExbD [Candidatus Scalindua sp.]MBT6561686.1 biopolymer transporter ExbD [Candidatus Scalindua sp.]
MQFRVKRYIKPVINIASLVDVLFLLLIFFMVTSAFVEQPNIKLELPATRHSEVSKIDRTVLTISRDGQLFLQDRPVDKINLEKELRRIVLDTGDEVLVLKADKMVPYGDVVDIMDDAKGAGFRKVVAPTIMEE